MGLGAGPYGMLFVRIDAHGNTDGLRMFTVDPVTLQFAPHAYIDHDVVAANTAGVYNSTHDFAIAMDSFNDVLRAYVQSPDVQEGTIFAGGVSGEGGSGEQTRMITFRDTVNGYASPSCDGDTDGDDDVDISDLPGLLGALGSADPACDVAPPLAGDGVVDILDLLFVLSGWGPC